MFCVCSRKMEEMYKCIFFLSQLYLEPSDYWNLLRGSFHPAHPLSFSTNIWSSCRKPDPTPWAGKGQRPRSGCSTVIFVTVEWTTGMLVTHRQSVLFLSIHVFFCLCLLSAFLLPFSAFSELEPECIRLWRTMLLSNFTWHNIRYSVLYTVLINHWITAGALNVYEGKIIT